jgi:hypothetical protein
VIQQPEVMSLLRLMPQGSSTQLQSTYASCNKQTSLPALRIVIGNETCWTHATMLQTKGK